MTPDLVYVSQVLFGSGYALADLSGLVQKLWAPDRLIVIDGYHGFLARPTDLAAGAQRVSYPRDGWRFAGATFDPTALYRLRAVLDWLAAENIDAALIHAHAVALQSQFMAATADEPPGPFAAERLVVPLNEPARGNFLAFEHPDAAQWWRRLHAAGIVTDVRGTRLRLGFGLYHTAADVERLVTRLRRL